MQQVKRETIKMDLNELEQQNLKQWGDVTFAHLRIDDKDNNRFTDCWLSAYTKNGRVHFVLNHEKGYPTQNKGSANKTIRANWLSNELPKLN